AERRKAGRKRRFTLHRDGVLRVRRTGGRKNETAGNQEGRKAPTASILGATSIGHGKFTLRIHANCSDMSTTGYCIDAGAISRAWQPVETPPLAFCRRMPIHSVIERQASNEYCPIFEIKRRISQEYVQL